MNPRAQQQLAGLALVALAVLAARRPAEAPAVMARLAQRFSFERHTLEMSPGAPARSVRSVNPSLNHIAGWISTVGAGVALTDLDGDGLPNDVCLVDPRTDRVMLAPAPGTSRRFEPFWLDEPPGHGRAPMGCLPGDLNEDGHLDVLVYHWGRPPLLYLRLDGVPAAERFQALAVVDQRLRWYTNAATLADIDGDGHLDVIIGNYFQDGARILDSTATIPDVMQHSMSRAANGGRNRLLRWVGRSPAGMPLYADDTTALAGTGEFAWTLATGAADLDGDLRPEIYFANDFGPDVLLHNRSTPGRPILVPVRGRRGLATPASKVLGFDSYKGMGVEFVDLNGRGLLDILVSNIAAPFALQEGHLAYLHSGVRTTWLRGVAPFVDAAERLGLAHSEWAWDIKAADFDNDAVPEVVQTTGFLRGGPKRWSELQELATANDQLLANPAAWPRFRPGDDLSGHTRNPFFVRSMDGRYSDVAAGLVPIEPGTSRGIAIADTDGDGRLDYAIANQWSASSFYRNRSPGAGAFIGLHLLLPPAGVSWATAVEPGHAPGRPAIGATALIEWPNGRILAEVDGGNGHGGKRAPDIFTGLGVWQGPVQVSLGWRDATGTPCRTRVTLTGGWYSIRLASPCPQVADHGQ